MGLTITKMLLPSSKYSLKCPNAMSPIGVTVHETGNIATAMSEISYMIGNNSSTSYHFAVDETRAVQGLPLNRNGFHSGDGSSGRGNAKTIGVEHCYNWSGKATTKNDSRYNPLYKKALTNGIELIAQLFIDHPQWGVPEHGKNIWRHYDHVGKNCPQRMIEEGYWNTYVALVKARYLELKGGKPSTSQPTVTGAYTVKKGDTLWGIANSNKTTVDNIKSLNGLKSDLITPGQSLKLSETVTAAKPAPTPAPVKPKYTTGTENTGGVQTFLNTNFNSGLTVDNLAGAATRKALIKALQTELNRQFNAKLTVDGLWGPATRKACATVRKGANGNITRLIQAALICKGYSVGGFDGIFGDGLYNAVIRFQKANGLAADGVVGQATFEALFR